MSTNTLICPKCNQYPSLSIEITKVELKCQCGYKGTISIKECLPPSNQFNISINSNNSTTNEVKSAIRNQSEEIFSYFHSLQEDYIQKLELEIKRIRDSYYNCLSRNTDIITFLHILIDNYSHNQNTTMYNNIINNSNIYFHKCEIIDNLQSIIDYFDNYVINKIKPIHYDTFTSLQPLSQKNEYVNTLLLLKDGRLASALMAVKVYDLDNNYHLDFTIDSNGNYISSMCQLDNGDLIICDFNSTIHIWNISQYSYTLLFSISLSSNHSYPLCLSLSNNRFASYSKTFKIWKGDKAFSTEPITILNYKELTYIAARYIKEKDLLIAIDINNIMYIWSMATYQLVSTINNIKCCWSQSLYQIDSDRIIIGGYEVMTIVNISKGIIEYSIKDKQLEYVRSFMLLRTKDILCGCSEGKICIYNPYTKEYQIMSTVHNSMINYLFSIDDYHFISYTHVSILRKWYY